MSSPIKLIVGLGNPGPEYENTRHNAGEWFIQNIAQDCGTELRLENKFHGLTGKANLSGQTIYLLFPTTFMNHSGQAVGAISKYYKIKPEEILVAHDELDLASGQLKLKYDGGHGGHNGLRDIISHLSSKQFYRLRIGIGHPGDASKVLNYVLSRPNASQRQAIDDALINAHRALPDMLDGNMQKAMKDLHTKTD